MMTNTCDAYQQAHKKFFFIVRPFQQSSKRSLCPRCPCKNSFFIDNDESIPKWEWKPQPQDDRQEHFWTIIPVPSSIDLATPPPRPPSDDHFTP
ncbi:hypothetical protein O181_037546 [Austropuccinia psidii MF-1]|uniref:Uncharacterized protein n=1 Tax=Austropuccinia psidii MF-1 TaxID=1389203 RepID=A0A9Q3HAV8_9BASI|nr:hypothetical protein [Austropuccinia psidii MF-1]